MTLPLRRRRSVRIAAIAVLAAATTVLSACSAGGGTSTAADTGTPVKGGTLKLAFWPDNPNLTSIDPFQIYWIETRTVLRNVVDSLTDQDPKTGELVPWLATDWKAEESNTKFTFDLKQGVTFSDGTPFTADSVKLAFDSDAAEAKAIPGVFGASYISGYEGTKVVDDDTVEVTFAKPNAAFLQATSTTTLGILAASSYAKTAEQRSAGEIIGSGPFTLDSYAPTKGIELSRRTGYDWASKLNAHQGDAYLKHVSVSYVAEDSVRLGQLTSGAIDVDWPRNPFSAPNQQVLTASGDTLEQRSLPGPSYTLYPNVSAGHVLADQVVRQALQKAIDRASYAKTIFGAKYPIVTSLFDTTTPFYSDRSGALGFDLAGATALLDGDGWKVGSDGYRHKGGKTLTIDYPTNATFPGDQLLQDQLKQAGIKLDIRVETAAQWAADRAAGKYDLGVSYLTRADPSVAQSILDTRYATAAVFAQNAASAEQQQKIQSLFDQGRAAESNDARDTAYTALQQYLIDDQSLAFPLFERVQHVGVSSKVHGFRFTSEAFGSFSDIWLAS